MPGRTGRDRRFQSFFAAGTQFVIRRYPICRAKYFRQRAERRRAAAGRPFGASFAGGTLRAGGAHWTLRAGGAWRTRRSCGTLRSARRTRRSCRSCGTLRTGGAGRSLGSRRPRGTTRAFFSFQRRQHARLDLAGACDQVVVGRDRGAGEREEERDARDDGAERRLTWLHRTFDLPVRENGTRARESFRIRPPAPVGEPLPSSGGPPY